MPCCWCFRSDWPACWPGCVAVHPGAGWLSGAEGAFCCIACPTATAASVVVRKLGGNVPTITTYILLSSFVSAVALPLFLPLMEHDSHLRFLSLCLLILRRVTPTLIAPFLLATLIRWAWPRLGRRLADVTRDAAFYLWGFTLTILMAQTIHSVYGSHVGGTHVLLAAAWAWRRPACCFLRAGGPACGLAMW